MKKGLCFLALPLFLSAFLTNCNNSNSLTIWVDSKIVDLTKSEVEEFRAANPEFTYSVRVDTVSEQQAATNMITDVQGGADIFVYAQDQFARLISAGALSSVPNESEDEMVEDGMEAAVKAAHVDGAINAVTYQGENDKRKHIYSYPVTSDNGYFLYYNKKYFNESYGTGFSEKYKTVEGILEVCKAVSQATGKNKTFGIRITDGWWYCSGFFFSHKIEGSVISDTSMCKSNWTTSSSGKFIATDDDFAKNGQFACKAMAKIFNSGYHLDEYNGLNMQEEKGCIALVDGNWDYSDLKEKYVKEDLGIAKLPTFTVDDNEYQMGSFSGYKLMGVKPHEDSNKAYWCAKLAKYLTDTKCQLDRFESVGWGPSDKAALEDEEVSEAPGLKALAEQNKYAIPQGSYPNNWWKVGNERISGQIKASKKTTLTDEEAQTYLDDYNTQILDLIEEE